MAVSYTHLTLPTSRHAIMNHHGLCPAMKVTNIREAHPVYPCGYASLAHAVDKPGDIYINRSFAKICHKMLT